MKNARLLLVLFLMGFGMLFTSCGEDENLEELIDQTELKEPTMGTDGGNSAGGDDNPKG
ncbi:MAG: hypothetical protein JXQ90_01050 [Cyclobacteriaceae bacterium]